MLFALDRHLNLFDLCFTCDFTDELTSTDEELKKVLERRSLIIAEMRVYVHSLSY